ncbi:hypothetical protein QG37_01046 [Candidozyma auris]|nr:hypothetical protein QG37_01046 [[Candida] auris]
MDGHGGGGPFGGEIGNVFLKKISPKNMKVEKQTHSEAPAGGGLFKVFVEDTQSKTWGEIYTRREVPPLDKAIGMHGPATLLHTSRLALYLSKRDTDYVEGYVGW